MNEVEVGFDFKWLVSSIGKIHNELKQQAFHNVNTLLTLRNWLIGYYIVEYELKGSDRADYGDKLFERLETELKSIGLTRSSKRDLYRLRLFYNTYPQILESLTPQLQKLISHKITPKSSVENIHIDPLLPIMESATPQSAEAIREIITKLSFTHIEVLIDIEDKTKRQFYEFECIRGNWSVRELKRQVHSLYFERMVLSTDKNKLSEQTQQKGESFNPTHTIRDPYIFEFLGLKSREVMSESHLEDQLLEKLQDFLLELGHGFCFEARQKAILIGDTNFYIDLVFYHRILKCHVLIELKLTEFNHEHIGQLNTYLSWYSKNVKELGDNEPIGILLCTAKNNTLVEYALAGMDKQLFVSKYMLELPSKTEIQSFIKAQMN